MKKIFIGLLGIIGILVFLISLHDLYHTLKVYLWFWESEKLTPSTVKLYNGSIMLYDNTWIDFIKFSIIAIIGLCLTYLSDKFLKISKGQMVLKEKWYKITLVILILIPFYFTFLDSNCSFPDKMYHRSIENLINKKNAKK